MWLLIKQKCFYWKKSGQIKFNLKVAVIRVYTKENFFQKKEPEITKKKYIHPSPEMKYASGD